MKKHNNILVCLFCVLSLQLSIVNLKADEKDTLAVQTKEVRVTADKLLSDPSNKYHAYDVINHFDLQEKNGWQLSEIINSISGIHINDYGGLGGLKTVSMRGTSSNQSLILIDGIKVNSSQNGISDLSNISTGQFNNIEVVRGGSSAMYGGSAIGGLINLSSSDFLKDQYMASLHYGSFNQQLLKAGYIFGKQDLNESLFFEYKKSDGNYIFSYRKNNRKFNRENDDYSSFSLSSLTRYLVQDWRLQSRIIITNSRRGIPGAITNDNNANQTSDSRLNEENIIAIISSIKQFDDLSSFYLTLHNNVNHYKYTDPDFLGSGFSGLISEFTNRDIGLDTKYNFILSGFNCRSGLEFGFSDLRGNQLDYSIGDYINRKNAALSFSSESEYEISNYILANYSGGLRFDSYSKAGNAFSFIFGLLLNFNQIPMRLRSQISKNFRPPSFNEMYYLNYGNKNLLSEKSISINEGILFKAFDNISLTMDLFYISTDDKIIYVPYSQVSGSAQNLQNVVSKGIEISIEGDYFEKSLKYKFAYTMQDVRDQSNNSENKGKLVVYMPQEIISASVIYKINGFSFGSFMNYSSYYYSLPDNSNGSIMSSYLLIDIFASYEFKIANTISGLRIDCKNVFDENYSVILNYPMPGRYIRAGISINYD